MSQTKTTTAPRSTAKKAAEAPGKAAEAPRKAAQAPRKVPEPAPAATEAPEPVADPVPEAVRSLAEQGVAQSREAYGQAKDAMEEAVEVLERTFDEAGQGAIALNRKVIDIAQTNLNSGFDLAKSLASARTMAEVMELQVNYMRRQFEQLAAQAEEIRTLTSQVAADSAEPITAHVSKSMAGFKLAS